MGKRILNLYVDDEDIQIAKSKRMNLSQIFRNIMKVETSPELDNVNDKELALTLKYKLAIASSQINEITHQNEKEKKELKENIEKLNKKIESQRIRIDDLTMENIKLKSKKEKRGIPVFLGDGS